MCSLGDIIIRTFDDFDSDFTTSACLFRLLSLRYDNVRNSVTYKFDHIYETIEDDERVEELTIDTDDTFAFVKLLQYDGSLLKNASERLKNNEFIVWIAAGTSVNSLEYAGDNLKSNREFATKIVNTFPKALKYFPIVQDDYELVLKCVKENGSLIKFASERLQRDSSLILQAINTYGKALRFLPMKQRTRELVKKAISNTYFSEILNLAPEEFRYDSSMVMRAIKKSFITLCDAPEELKNDEEFLFKALQFGAYLEYIPQGLKKNEDFMLASIELVSQHFEEASKELQENVEFCLKAIILQPQCVDYIDLSIFDRETKLDLLTGDEIIGKLLLRDISLQNDRDAILKSVRIVHDDGGALQYASDRLRNDREIVLEAIICEPCNFEFVSEQLKQDEQIIEMVLFRDINVIDFVPEEIKNDPNFILKAIKHSTKNYLLSRISIIEIMALESDIDRKSILDLIKTSNLITYKSLPVEFQNDREIFLQILQKEGSHLNYFPKQFKDDREIVLTAVRVRMSLGLVKKKFRNDREIVCESVKVSGHNLSKAAEKFKDDEQIVYLSSLHSSQLSGLRYASPRLRNDKKFISQVVKMFGRNLEFASTDLRNDPEIVKLAIESDSHSFEHASYELRQEREIVLMALKKSYRAVCYITSDELLNDEEVIEIALRQSTMSLKYFQTKHCDKNFLLQLESSYFSLDCLPFEFRKDREIVLKSVQCTGESINHITSIQLRNELKNDRQVMLQSIKKSVIAFLYASHTLQQDEQFIYESIEMNGLVLQYLPLKYKFDKNTVLRAVQQNGLALIFASYELLKDREIVLRAVQQNGEALEYTSPQLKNDKQIVLEAIKTKALSFKYATVELKSDFEFVSQAFDINIEILQYAHYSLRFNIDFLRKMNKDNRLLDSSLVVKKRIGLKGLLGYEPLLIDLSVSSTDVSDELHLKKRKTIQDDEKLQ